MCVQCYKLAADEGRHKILTMLKGRTMTVNEITDRLHVKQPTVSHHLKLLAEAKLVTVKKDGRKRLYGLKTDSECYSDCGLLKGLK
ncbi:MAG TPA: metalloregulator ArsR/SmtB family transcription factor [Candidatus Binatia bacterium]|jgi:DNA-binding transcriptional ArsR family regulator|nr:metalloregulator ArsR/SmtB family transcription factor [Candidatus Binatia bacterium]